MGLPLLLFLGLLALSRQTVPSTFIAPPAVYHITQQTQIYNADTTVPYRVKVPDEIGSLADAIIEGNSGCKMVYDEPTLMKGSYIDIPVDKEEIAGSSWMT